MQNSLTNILFIVNTLKRRGAEQQLFSFFKFLPPSIAIHVFTFSSNREDFPELFDYRRVTIHTNPHAGTYNIFRFLPLLDCFRREDIDVVVTVGLGAALMLGRVAAVLFNRKIIYSTLNTFVNFNRLPRVNDAYFDILNKGINNFFTFFFHRRIFRFLPNSEQLAAMVKKSLKAYPVQTLYNGLPLNELSGKLGKNAARTIEPILSEIEGRPCVIQVGAIDKNKNVAFTLECMRNIHRHVPDALLVIIGDGPQKPDLEKRVEEYSLSDHVHFTGQLGRAACLALMRSADVITLTSLSESFPNVLLEGQGLGLAAITSDVGAAKEIVSHEETGYVIPAGDQNAFTERLQELLEDGDKCKAMGQKGKERILERFSMDRKVDAFMTMVKEDMRRLGND